MDIRKEQYTVEMDLSNCDFCRLCIHRTQGLAKLE